VKSKKQVVASYMDGFRRSDHQQILACLTDDVVWEIAGFRRLEGKVAFDGEIANEGFTGSPTLSVDRLVEDAETVVAIGEGASTRTSGETHRFAFCDVFTFDDGAICRVESYVVPLQHRAA
jgi:ketosteroid isomerase-like protein